MSKNEGNTSKNQFQVGWKNGLDLTIILALSNFVESPWNLFVLFNLL